MLLVSPKGDDRQALQNLFPGQTIVSVGTITDALAALGGDGLKVVICHEDLPDGRWSDLMRELDYLESPPPLIVLSPHADDYLWADVLRAGAHDLLATPLEPRDALRAISVAVRQAWQPTEQQPVRRMAAMSA
jgi:FixJ family two-component response regulator